MLLLLEGQELMVTELSTVMQLPQSTASRQLRTLADDGWVVSRAEGTSRWYRLSRERLDAAALRLWDVVRAEIAGSIAAEQDRQRLAAILAERRKRAQEFFAQSASEWDALRGELFGDALDQTVALALLDEEWVVGDLGCGTGRVTEALAPFVARAIGVDESDAMLSAASARLAGESSVSLRKGPLEQLPIADAELDAAILCLVLHYVTDPAQVLREAHRVLRPGGRVLVVDMMPHDRDDFRARMGHVWLGFDATSISHWMEDAGFERTRYRALRADARATGPALFAATARTAEVFVRGNGTITELDF